jgi:hypothetical protein
VLALSLIELKKKILRLLREDEEFKLAVAGCFVFHDYLWCLFSLMSKTSQGF